MTMTLVPSQVVDLIDTLYPDGLSGVGGRPLTLGADGWKIRAVVDSLDCIPPTMLVLSGTDLEMFLAARAACRNALSRWESGDQKFMVGPITDDDKSPLALIRDALESCPDTAAPAASEAIDFLDDPELRSTLESDISAVNTALHYCPANELASSRK